MVNSRLKITDTTFRDAHQSILATRLRTADMESLASDMESVGFHSLEVWGGATFDAATRFLGEDPWERLRIFKQLMPTTPLMMLLRGQSLVGYRNYSDDVVDAFIKHASETGIDIFRVFDALNDDRNLSQSASAVKASGKHLQMTICYSVTNEGRLGGDIYNLDYFVDRAKVYEGMNADSICIKDMAGLLSPYDAFVLVNTLKNAVSVPLQLHSHYTSGMASMSYIKAIDAGIDVIDTCLAPLALRTSQPAVEPIVTMLGGTERDTGLNLKKLTDIGNDLEAILPAYQEHMQTHRISIIDVNVLSHQVPGGMISNLTSQLREADALDKIDDVLAEIPRTRKDLGFPPLVTPISQMIGSQAVSNVLFGRYEMISQPIIEYALGMYGTPPASLDPDVAKRILAKSKNRTPITNRPGDFIDPELDSAKEAIKDISTDIEDVLTYALYPTTGLKFLKTKYGLDPVKEIGTTLINQPSPETIQIDKTDEKNSTSRTFDVRIQGETYRVEVDSVEQNVLQDTPVLQKESSPDTQSHNTNIDDAIEISSISSRQGEVTLRAPMPGLILSYSIEIGEHVEKGDTILILEAMKMENSIPSPISGTIKNLTSELGGNVSKGDMLAIIEP